MLLPVYHSSSSLRLQPFDEGSRERRADSRVACILESTFINQMMEAPDGFHYAGQAPKRSGNGEISKLARFRKEEDSALPFKDKYCDLFYHTADDVRSGNKVYILVLPTNRF